MFQVFSPNGDEMFWTKAQSDIPSIPILDPSDILPPLLTSPSNEASQAQLQLQLQPHLHAHTLSGTPSFSNDSLSIVKALVGTLDDDYLDLKSGNDKGNLQIPSPEAMFRSWDSYGSYPSSGDTSAHGISISNNNGNGNGNGNGNSGSSSGNGNGNGIVNGGSNGMNNTNTINNSTYTNNNNNNSSNNLNGTHNNLNNNNNNTGTMNININNSKQQPNIEKSVLYESIHDKSVLRNSAVWDPWKYGNGEPQRPYQLP